jgi:2-hydroxychromene-2-carboxylate isomerase
VQYEGHEHKGPWLSFARLRYMQADLARCARRLRVGFHFPSRHPTNTIQALRLCVQAQERSEALHQALALRLFRAYWVYDEDLLDTKVLVRILNEVGLPPEELLAGCTHPEVKEALRSQTEAAIACGVFDAPTFIVGDELFFSNDRLDFVETALRNLTAP